MNIKVNFHSSVIINENIYIDPLNLEHAKKAKYVFITHPHWDHYSKEDVNKIIDENTKIICPLSMKNELADNHLKKAFFVEPNKAYVVDDIMFETFPSYNINKNFHPKANNWVGYTLNINNKRISIVGDSDSTKELQQLKTDILLLPIGGTYTMDVQEAANLTNTIKPQMAIPTHYGEVVGDKNLGNRFAKLIDKNIKVDVMLYSNEK